MKCPNCNYETNHPFEYCPNCGAEYSNLSVSINPAADKILQALKDPLFLIICILMTISSVSSLAASDGLPVFNILFSIFLWITYSAAQKDFADERQLKNLSGTVYANYVVTNVAAVLLFVMGIIFGFAISLVARDNSIKEEIIAELYTDLPQEAVDIATSILNLSGWFFFIIFAIIAVLCLVINLLCLRKIHRFAKSIYQSVENCTLSLENTNATRTILFIFGGLGLFSTITQLGDPLLALSALTTAITEIFAGILIGKYFITKNTYEGNYYAENT